MQELVIIRGLPGSGKSTFAKSNFAKHKQFEADMFFVRKNGEYKFDFTKLNAAHTWCQQQVIETLKSGHDVVVTNTFTQSWEFDAYMSILTELALSGIEVSLRIIEMKTQYQNIHGVPEDKMQKMRDRWHQWDSVKEDLGLIDGENVIYEVVE